MPKASFKDIAVEIRQAKALPEDAETKGFDWDVKALDGSGQLSMYVAYFNNVDRGGDCIEPGAFKNVEDFARSGWMGINHCMDSPPIGFPISVVQDSKGLLCKFQFHSTQAAQEARSIILDRMNASKSVAGSIGYKVRPGGSRIEYKDGKSVRMLTDVDIFEASWVNLPMNPRAEALSAKSLEGLNVDDKIMTVEALKTWLDEQTKAGRVLSKANHGMIKAWHGTLSTMCNDMKALVDQFDPGNPNPDDVDADGKGGSGIAPTMGSTKAPTNQRNAAGNAIPADQNPRGAVIAADIPGKSLVEYQRQKEEQLNALRARVLQDQFRFARS